MIPLTSGIMAPPTMAMHKMPEPFGAASPSPSTARAKIVGNMMELQRPIAMMAAAAVAPVENDDSSASAAAKAPQTASATPGGTTLSTPAPINRPHIAPPQ